MLRSAPPDLLSHGIGPAAERYLEIKMTKKMLIDATHAEETRVAVVDRDTLDEFDYESIVRKQMKGSIFLAKVTRVEPSLQAAFVNFGGNRHGFLPFSEIHPDYFRIPVADREAFLAAQEAELAEHDQHNNDDDDEDEEDSNTASNEDDEDEEDEVVEVGGADKPAKDDDDLEASDDNDDSEEGDDEEDASGNKAEEPVDESKDPDGNIKSEDDDSDDDAGNKKNNNRGRNNRRGRGRNNRRGRGRRANADSRKVEMVGGDGADNDRPFRFNMRRQYKIQEVIKRGQIMLIQVSKEERGNKGAAVTSYLSLPGRYCVLMPNSPRAGGVSRKIANYKDRKRMKGVLDELNVPEGMSVILRTAGVQRTKAEIKRDLDYLLRLWNNIRELTLKSSAPAVVYEEGNLIKRSIRDLYTKDIDEVHVAGEQGYKSARDFMKMLIPSHVKRVKEYKDDQIPLFHHYKVEQQIAEIGEPSVTLKSGGYLVINPTEALVSVDVNSGRATKERHIEETALKTNLEAATEVARQLRLRDLGGLVVIDFIDMEDRRNNRKVENKLRDALSSDRARIQIGRISSFGLLELSRQRLNPSLTEAMFKQCEHCQGTGIVRTEDASAIRALRALEEEGIKGKAAAITMAIPTPIAIYILNNKRAMLADIESRYGFKVSIQTNDDLIQPGFEIQVTRKKTDDDEDDANDNDAQDNTKDEKSSDRGGRKRGRRGGRGRGRRNDKNKDDSNQDSQNESDVEEVDEKKKPAAKASKSKAKTAKADKADESEDKPKKPRGRKPKADKDEVEDKKPAKPKAKKAETIEKAEDKPAKPKPSNDTKPVEAAPKDYEVVNEAPEKKKKGWWNKIVE
ncbi:MAG: ribonuclease E/G [Pseudomonadota bacterium]